MNALTLTNENIIAAPAHDLQANLFNDFIAWIDRSANTTRAYIINLRQFMAWLRYTGTTRPARQDIILYREWLTAEHDAIQLDDNAPDGWKYRTDSIGNPVKVTCKPATIVAYLRSVCAFFKWAAAAGHYPNIASNVHAPKVQHDNHKKEALTPADVLTIEQSIDSKAAQRLTAASEADKDTNGRMQRTAEQSARLRAMYLLAVNAGLRTIELHRANIKDIEVKAGRATLYIWGKGHTEPDQKKPLAPEVYAAIREYIDTRSDKPNGFSPLFVATGNRSTGKRIAVTTISKMLKQAMIEAGYNSDRLTAHSLRHTAGNNVMTLTGKNLFLTQAYMRHSNPTTTEIYLHQETEREETTIAQQLYNLYHGDMTNSARSKLEGLIDRLTPDKMESLTAILEAMV